MIQINSNYELRNWMKRGGGSEERSESYINRTVNEYRSQPTPRFAKSNGRVSDSVRKQVGALRKS